MDTKQAWPDSSAEARAGCEKRPAGRGERVCVVVVTYNSASVVGGLLDSLASGLRGIDDHEIIIVDNQSADGSAEVAEAHPIRPRVIRMGSNAGYAAGINAAATIAGADAHLLILNPDVRLTGEVALKLLDQLQEQDAGIVLPQNFREDGTVDPTIRREPSIATAWCEGILGGKRAARLGLGEIDDRDRRYERAGPVAWATASALLVAAEARRTVGQWDESYFLYSEEVDYQRRVRQAGFRILYVPHAHVTHIGGEYRVNPRLYALLTCNRIRYFRRNHGLASTVLFRLGIALGEGLRCWRSPVHRRAFACALLPLRPAFSFRTEGPAAPVPQ